MISAQPVTIFTEHQIPNTCKASTEMVLSKKKSLVDFLSTYNTVSQLPVNYSVIDISNTALYKTAVLKNTEAPNYLTSIIDLISTANNLFSHTKPLTGEFMDLLDITFQKSLSSDPYEI